MIEAIVSILVVGVMLVAALNTVGAARLGEQKIAQRNRGLALAQDLMSEILQQAYADPEAGEDSFAVDAGEVGDGSRNLWEDVDDYHGWSASPPQQKDGTVMTGLEGWERSVQVVWADPSNLFQTVGTNQGAKRITVTVTHDGLPVASLFAFRTSAWPGLDE